MSIDLGFSEFLKQPYSRVCSCMINIVEVHASLDTDKKKKKLDPSSNVKVRKKLDCSVATKNVVFWDNSY